MSALTGSKVKKSNQFETNNLSALLVTGSLIGTLVGGSSTIGTAQLAYSNGFSAWWFTLGGGLGVLLIGIGCLNKIYRTGQKTLPGILKNEYGNNAGYVSAILSSAGTFLSIVAQIISGASLIMSVTSFNFLNSIVIVAVLIILYVLWGGALALGYGGLLKTVLLSGSVIICGFYAMRQPAEIISNTVLPHDIYFNILGRGAFIDLGAGLSLIIGVLTTQSYLSAVLSAKNKKEGKKGCIFTAFIVPLIGISCIFVGMYMKLHYPDIDTKMALPMFIIHTMNPFVAGIMIMTLLIAVIGTGAGLSFGMASVIYHNLLTYFHHFKSGEKNNEKGIMRMIIFLIILIGSLLCYTNMGGIILQWSFLSMGLRGAVSVAPLIGALYFPNKIKSNYALSSMIVGLVFTIIGNYILPSQIDPLFLGVFMSFLVLICGYKRK